MSGQRDRVAIFIDGWNFAKATYDGLNIRVDFTKLLTFLKGESYLVKAMYYIGEWTEESYQMSVAVRNRGETVPPMTELEFQRKQIQQNGFLRMLKRNGYRAITKSIKVFADGNSKADMDIELACDMFRLAPHVDKMIVVSGDADFIPALELVHHMGVRTVVMGSQRQHAYDHTPQKEHLFPARAGDELVAVADEFIEIDKPQVIEAIKFVPSEPRKIEPPKHDA